MRATYRVLAHLVALAVVVQAAAIAAVAAGGYPVHAAVGNAVPVLALALLAVSLRAGVPGGVGSAVVVAVLTGVQVGLGHATSALPLLGVLHGVTALVLFAAALEAARRVRSAPPARARVEARPVVRADA